MEKGLSRHGDRGPSLGDDVDLSPGAVPEALARLAVEAPGVYSAVLTELSGSHVRLDSERELLRRRRSSLLRRALFWWGEHETEVGDRLIDKRAVAVAVVFGLAGLLLVVVGVSSLAGRHSAPRARRVVPAAAVSARRIPRRPPHRATSVRDPLGLGASSRWTSRFPEVPLPAVPAAAVSADAGRPNPVVYSRGAPDERGAAPPVVYSRPPDQGPAPPGVLRTDTAEADDALSSGAEAPGTAPPYGTGSPASSPRRWTPGQRVAARLVTGAVGVAGAGPSPVIAEGPDPDLLWLGSVTPGGDGLLQITFALASSPQRGAVKGIALDPERLTPGLPGRSVMRRPQAAAAVLASALRAAAYVQDLARQGQVTVGDAWARVTVGPAAPPWAYLAAQLAQEVPPGGRLAAPVETVELAPRTPLVILVTEVP